MVKPLPGLGELGPLQVEHSGELTLALHPFLIGRGEAGKADSSHQHQTNLHRQADDAAEENAQLDENSGSETDDEVAAAAKAAANSEAEVVEVAETETKATKKSAAPSIPVPMF